MQHCVKISSQSTTFQVKGTYGSRFFLFSLCDICDKLVVIGKCKKLMLTYTFQVTDAPGNGFYYFRNCIGL